MALDSKIEPNDLNFEKKSLYGKTDDIVEPGELISADSFVGVLDRQDKEQLEETRDRIQRVKDEFYPKGNDMANAVNEEFADRAREMIESLENGSRGMNR